jgi:flagellar biosynthetic protein FlhB
MAENKERQEKTEQASAKRLQEARARGQVSKSMDVTTAAILFLGGASLFILGGPMINQLQDLMRYMLHDATNIQVTDQNVFSFYLKLLVFLAKILLPILGVIFAISFASEVGQVGFHFATKKFSEGLQFKQIFNPFSGLKKIFFSGRSAFELVKSIVKLSMLGLVVYWVIAARSQETVSLVEKPFAEVGAFLVSMSKELMLKVGGCYIIIALADYLYQKHRFREDMKMTKQEVREETKQTEGDPKIKSRIRSLMRQRIRRLMLQNVKKAEVVIMNPTHFAVALSYKQASMSAPILVAKGVDFLALQIRQIAEDNNVPIVVQPPLARAIYYSVDFDQEIPENLFKAVAQVLAYVFTLKKKMIKSIS